MLAQIMQEVIPDETGTEGRHNRKCWPAWSSRSPSTMRRTGSASSELRAWASRSVAGQAASISTGEWITAPGEWVNDRTHGQQFRARFLKTSAPTSIKGIEKYLASGMIRGIGPAYAKRLARASGKKCST
jgi:hypothetical protein